MSNFIKVLITLAVCNWAFTSTAQTLRPADLVAESQSLTPVRLFESIESKSVPVSDQIGDYQLVSVRADAIEQLLVADESAITLTLPIADKTADRLELLLVPVALQSVGDYVVSEPSGDLVKVQGGRHYRGIIKGNDKSTAAVSVYDGEVMALITAPSMGNVVVGKLAGETAHIIYNDAELLSLQQFQCGTPDGTVQYDAQELKADNGGQRALSDCVKLYFEVDYDIYQDKGGMTGTTNYVTGLYNQVATMYANENINTVLQPLVVWTQTSPYSSGSSSGMLNQFTAYRQGFDGDLAMLLSYQASGGIAYVDGLCSSNPDYSMSFSSIASTYNVVPTYSWSVMVVTHEFGHLFGSQHTHACVWNGNNTAIDGCYTTEGSCGNPGVPSGGGTVMSYCHLTNVGINLNLGFGPQPGNLIRNRVANASCTDACNGGGGPTCTDGIQNGQETGTDCGGPDCPACPTACSDNEAVLTLVLDNYPTETAWTLTNSQGTIVYSGGGYSDANSTVTLDVCLADGCFDFNITDSYGDGICCAYGEGSYTVSDDSGVLITGGQFGSVDTQNFCLGAATPTCSDGVQNGNETGIDCGGADCPACESCSDGIQNGQETGIDCGGPDCAACPSCDDGVQNGGETGIDCGGPDCLECPTGCVATEATLILVLDNYPTETAWTITDASGVALYAGAGYTNANSTVEVELCLLDGCYDFNITDSYGDGICCAYGQGSYTIETVGDALISGGQFGSSEVQEFCIGDTEPTPTCDDGVQNGSETGIDCGGPDCDPCSVAGDEIIFAHFFETGWDGWQDGGSDCYRYTGTRSYEGDFSIRLRDNSGAASTMTSAIYNTSPYSGLELEFYFYPNSMEAGEDFSVGYYDGSSWQTVATFVSGTSFNNNQFYTAVVPILASDYDMSLASQFRFTCDASSNADRVYIDAVTVTGLSGGSLPNPDVKVTALGRAITPLMSATEVDITLAPNPTSEMLYVGLQSDASYNSTITISDILGAVVLQQQVAIVDGGNDIAIQVVDLYSGTYILSMTDEEGEPVVSKFIKLD